jgi:hypothetical protein
MGTEKHRVLIIPDKCLSLCVGLLTIVTWSVQLTTQHARQNCGGKKNYYTKLQTVCKKSTNVQDNDMTCTLTSLPVSDYKT